MIALLLLGAVGLDVALVAGSAILVAHAATISLPDPAGWWVAFLGGFLVCVVAWWTMWSLGRDR